MDAVWPVVRAIGWVLSPLVLFYLLLKYLSIREERKWVADVRASLGYLVHQYKVQWVSNEAESPPSFDYAGMTFQVEDVQFRVMRRRGDLSVQVKRAHGGDAWHGVSFYVQRSDRSIQYFRRLEDLVAYLERNMPTSLRGLRVVTPRIR